MSVRLGMSVRAVTSRLWNRSSMNCGTRIVTNCGLYRHNDDTSVGLTRAGGYLFRIEHVLNKGFLAGATRP